MTRTAPSAVATDEELAAQRDVTILYARYAHRLLAFLAGRGIARADLEDAHHEVWLRVWVRLAEAPFQGHFRGWLFQIARNLATDHHRRKRPLSLGASEPAAARASPLDELMDGERQAHLDHCLKELTEEQSAVVRGRLGGESYEEVCTRLEMSEAKAYKLFFTAKQKLEACLDS